MRILRKFAFPVLIGMLLLILAACSGDDGDNGGDSPTSPAASSGATVGEGESVTLQLAWITRTSDAFRLSEQWADRIREKSNGRLDIQLVSYPELGVGGADTLRLMEDGTLPFTELYSGYIGGDLPFGDMNNLWGMYLDVDTQLAAIAAVKDDIAKVIDDHNGIIISYGYYPNNYIFSKKPLDSLADFEGMRTRTHSTVLGDLLSGLGADGQFMAFSEVYTALERGVMDAAITVLDAGYGQKWYEVTDYMTGPIVAYAQTWVTMNKDAFNKLPTDLQELLVEEGKWREEENLRQTKEFGDRNIQLNVDAGLELRDWPEEVKPLLRKTAIEVILPNWVSRTGGPESEAVKIFNEKVAPILRVRVLPDGTAEEY
jgi:TRAP-type C4-dicarboxylate transport system substrate-binding protein